MTWSLVNSWAYSGNVGHVDFTGLGSYSELMYLFRNITASGSVFRNLQVSDDNGSSFHSASGDYKTYDANGVATNAAMLPLVSAAGTGALSGSGLITNWDLSAPQPVFRFNMPYSAKIDLSVSPIALSAIRFLPDSGNFTGGNIYLFGR